MDFVELLAQYKENPRRESVALLLSEPVLLRYCVIFKQVPINQLMDQPLSATWGALWDCVDLDIETIALLADDELVKARKTMERLKGLRLVYPDGTIQALADKAIVKKLTDALS